MCTRSQRGKAAFTRPRRRWLGQGKRPGRQPDRMFMHP